MTTEAREKLDAEIEQAQAAVPTVVPKIDVRKLVAHPIATLFPLIEGEAYDQLVESIRGNGLRDPIILLEGQILDGRNRHRACMDAGVEPRFKVISTEVNPWDYVWDKNVVRRHLEVGQQGSIWIDFEEGSEAWVAEHEQVKVEANAARSAATKAQPRTDDGRRVRSRAPGTATRGAKKTGHEASAKRAGVSPSMLKRAKSLKHESPELHEKVKAGKLPLKKAVAAVKQGQKQALAASLDAKPQPLPTGPFDVIVSDPPWPYESRENDYTHRNVIPYPSMTIEQIKALPVGKLAAKDCVLWLWTTNAFMREAFAVLDAWGFKEKTILTWGKAKMGAGNWLRGKTEHCILAIRGKPTVTLTNETTLLEGEVREHSRKPESFFKLVEKLCHGTKLEMFSREERKGWSTWGAEAPRNHAVAPTMIASPPRIDRPRDAGEGRVESVAAHASVAAATMNGQPETTGSVAMEAPPAPPRRRVLTCETCGRPAMECRCYEVQQ